MRCSRLMIAVAVAVAVAGCSGPSTSVDAGVDARVDSGTDAGRDAGRDGGHDGGRDAGPRIDAGWRALDDLPDGCVVEVALDPEAVIPPLEIVPCEGRDGCTRMILPPESYLVGGVQTHHRDENFRYFLMGTMNGVYGRLISVVRDDGRVLGILNSDLSPTSGCSIGSGAIGGYRLLLSIRERVGAGIGRAFVLTADLSDIEGSITHLRTLTTAEMGPTNSPQYVEISDDVVAINTAPSHRLLRVENDGSMREVASERLSPDGAAAFLGPVLGDAILVERLGGRHRIEISRPDIELTELLVDPSDGEASTPLFDGAELVWLQLYGRQNVVRFDRVDLWASPAARRADELRPRLVASALPIRGPSREVWAGGGHVLVMVDLHSFVIYRLSDGARANFTVPASAELRGTDVVLDDEELAYLANRLTEEPYIEFIRYDSLNFE